MHSTPEEAVEPRDEVDVPAPTSNGSASSASLIDPDPSAVPARRRAPFAQNPEVGSRGSQTQQRIVQAAMELFSDGDYRSCRVEEISELAGCSRSSFYQYFSSKEDLIWQVTGQAARALRRIAVGDPITNDERGLGEIRDWLQRLGRLCETYMPMFSIFEVIADKNDTVATRGQRVVSTHAELLAARFEGSTVDGAGAQSMPSVVAVRLVQMALRAHWSRYARSRRDPTAGAIEIDADRLNDAMAAVIHRMAFGSIAGVNLGQARPAADRPPRRPRSMPGTRNGGQSETHDRFVEVATAVFVARGYDDTRIADVVEAAGTSQATFYRYFPGKQALYREVAFRAGRRLIDIVKRLPVPPTDREALRRWIADYIDVSSDNYPLTRTWLDASSRDPEFESVSLDAHELIRARLARFLEVRGFGDVDADALSLEALLVHGGRYHPWAAAPCRDPADLLLLLLERGFLEG